MSYLRAPSDARLAVVAAPPTETLTEVAPRSLVGHTPGSVALLYDDPTGPPHLWTGDSLFPGGVGKTSSKANFASLINDVETKIFARLPDETLVYPGHGDDTTHTGQGDATYCKARVGGDKAGKGARVASQAVVIATGVGVDGRREVLGCAVGDSETEAFWTEFLRSLRDRGLSGVQLVISDHHRGLMNAVDTTMAGVAWQRCRVHYADVGISSTSGATCWPR